MRRRPATTGRARSAPASAMPNDIRCDHSVTSGWGGAGRHDGPEAGQHPAPLDAFADQLAVSRGRLRRELRDLGEHQLEILQQQPGPPVLRRGRIEQQPVRGQKLSGRRRGEPLLPAGPHRGAEQREECLGLAQVLGGGEAVGGLVDPRAPPRAGPPRLIAAGRATVSPAPDSRPMPDAEREQPRPRPRESSGAAPGRCARSRRRAPPRSPATSPRAAARAAGDTRGPRPASDSSSGSSSIVSVPREIGERLTQPRSGPEQLRLRGAGLDAQRRGDLLVRVPLDVVHHEHRPVSLRAARRSPDAAGP